MRQNFTYQNSIYMIVTLVIVVVLGGVSIWVSFAIYEDIFLFHYFSMFKFLFCLYFIVALCSILYLLCLNNVLYVS